MKDKCVICANTEDLTPFDQPDSDKYICEECKNHINGIGLTRGV